MKTHKFIRFTAFIILISSLLNCSSSQTKDNIILEAHKRYSQTFADLNYTMYHEYYLKEDIIKEVSKGKINEF